MAAAPRKARRPATAQPSPRRTSRLRPPNEARESEGERERKRGDEDADADEGAGEGAGEGARAPDVCARCCGGVHAGSEGLALAVSGVLASGAPTAGAPTSEAPTPRCPGCSADGWCSSGVGIATACDSDGNSACGGGDDDDACACGPGGPDAVPPFPAAARLIREYLDLAAAWPPPEWGVAAAHVAWMLGRTGAAGNVRYAHRCGLPHARVTAVLRHTPYATLPELRAAVEGLLTGATATAAHAAAARGRGAAGVGHAAAAGRGEGGGGEGGGEDDQQPPPKWPRCAVDDSE